jgi:hypothetical protein
MVGRVYNRRHSPRTKVGLKSVENLGKVVIYFYISVFCGCVFRMCVFFGRYISLKLEGTLESGAWCVPRILKCLKRFIFQIENYL